MNIKIDVQNFYLLTFSELPSIGFNYKLERCKVHCSIFCCMFSLLNLVHFTFIRTYLKVHFTGKVFLVKPPLTAIDDSNTQNLLAQDILDSATQIGCLCSITQGGQGKWGKA